MTKLKKIALSLACILAALMTTADCATSQEPEMRSVRSIVAQRHAPNGGRMVINEFARSRYASNRSVARMDSLADALVRIALEDSSAISAAAIAELVIAAQPLTDPVYPNSANRIHEILRVSRAGPRRAMALGSLASVGPRSEAVKIWREVAMEPPTGGLHEQLFAVNLLCSRAGAEGRDVLLELHRTRAVTAAPARDALDFIVRNDFKRGCW